jgi:hypothetical protein
VGVCVRARQRSEEGGREVVCVGCRHAVGDKKSKYIGGRPGMEGKVYG